LHKRPSFSLYAFIIAILVHIIIVLLLAFIEKIAPTPPPKDEKPSESRFKVSLKEQPKAQKESLVKNNIPKMTKARPMPKGEQLKQLTPKAKPQPKVKPKEQVQEQQKQQKSTPIAQPTPIKPTSDPIPPEPKKAFERHVAKKVATVERKPKQEGLYDILSQADPAEPKSSSTSTSKVSSDIKKLYGDKFGELSEGEQKYILDNQEVMRRITQATLDRYGRSRIPDNLRADETNMIEFYLHPDGHISDIRFLKNSRFAILDDTTKETIEIAYSKYPRPAQKTYIRYRVWYNLN